MKIDQSDIPQEVKTSIKARDSPKIADTSEVKSDRKEQDSPRKKLAPKDFPKKEIAETSDVKSDRKAQDSPQKKVAPDVKERIHNHMSECGSQDPRHHDGGRHPYRYELWEVNENFSLQDFEEMVRGLDTMRDVRIVCMFDNEALVRIFRTQQLEDAVNEYLKKHPQQK